MCLLIPYLGTICPHIGQVTLAGGALLKNERIEEEAEGMGGAPLTSASFFFLFLLRDKLLRGLLFSGDVASDIMGLKSTSTARAASFQ